MAASPTILSGLILELFEQEEASPKEQIETLDLLREIIVPATEAEAKTGLRAQALSLRPVLN